MSRGATLTVLGLYNHDDGLFSEMAYPEGFSDDDKQTVVGNILSECAELEILYPDYETCKTMIRLWSKINLSVWNRIFSVSQLSYNPIENYNRTEQETITGDLRETHSGNDVNRLSGQDVQATTGSDTITNNGEETNTQSGNDTTNGIRRNSQTHSGTDSTTNSVTTYDSSTLQTHDKSDTLHGHEIVDNETDSNSIAYGKIEEKEATNTETMTHGKTDTLTHGRTETITHGEQITHDNETVRESHISGNIGVTTSQQMIEQEIEISAKLNVMQMIVESFKNRFCILVY